MNILWLIISMVIFFANAYLFMYILDRVDVERWKNYYDIRLKQPSINDLNDTNEGKGKISEYIRDVICPANKYFSLKRDLAESQKDNGANSLFCLAIQFFLFFIIVYNAMRVFPNMGMNDFWYCCIVGAVVIVICIIGYGIIFKIYNKTSNLPMWEYNSEDLKQKFITHKEEFDISEENSFNNFVINFHYEYLLSIKESILFRTNIRKVIVIASGIVNLLLYFQGNMLTL